MTVDYCSLLGTLEEFVFNEDKIVTYKWISEKLKIHANTAKQLLYSFTTKEDVNSKLLVTYIVSGITKDGSHKVTLVSSKNLTKVKESLKRVISEHVYSVQNVSLTLSVNDFYIVDKETFSKQEIRNAPIQINSDIIRKDIKRNPVQCAETSKIQQENNANKPKISEKSSPATKNESLASNCNQVERNNKSETETHNGTNISLIGSNKSKTSPKKVDKKVTKKNVPIKGGGIGAFFNKQAEDKTVQKSKSSEAGPLKNHHIEETENIPHNSLSNGQKIMNKSSEAVQSLATNDNLMASKKKKDESVMKKRKNSSESIGKNRKKMKRIVIASDSDSSGEDMEEEEEAPPPPVSPEPVAKPESDEEIIPPTPAEKGKKRVRKEVDRITTTDDGYLLTKKEYIYKSSSDEETEPKAKLQKSPLQLKSPVKLAVSPKKIKKSPKKKSPPMNKQSSIMNFFSRK